MTAGTIGFVGLGRMGGPMCANLARAGHELVAYDKAGTAARTPAGVVAADSVADLAGRAETLFLSLPDGAAVAEVTARIAVAGGRAATVVDLSTIGIPAAEAAAASLAAAGIEYVDAPVSGGVAGARKGTIALMAACSAGTFARLRPLFAGFAANPFHVGRRPGQGQAMKLLNNFLSVTAIAATSEAVAFGRSRGLDLSTMIEVLNASTGRNTATADKYPNRILTGSYDTGFSSSMSAKDLRLYGESIAAAGTPARIGEAVAGLIQAFARERPETDITRIHQYMQGESIND